MTFSILVHVGDEKNYPPSKIGVITTKTHSITSSFHIGPCLRMDDLLPVWDQALSSSTFLKVQISNYIKLLGAPTQNKDGDEIDPHRQSEYDKIDD